MLLDPRRGANVGAVCRAIANMGGGSLHVVGGDFDRDEAARTAVHAIAVFDSRREEGCFEDAVAPCSLVIGTTSRSLPWNIPVRPIDQVLAEARASGTAGECIALVFGPEDRGLSNEELARCHLLATIPTSGDYASLNLAQAAVVCLYEWLRSGRDGVAERAAVMADARAQAEALADLRAVLEEIGFLQGDQAERVMATISSMLTRSGPSPREVSILRGIVRQVRWASRRGSS